MPFAKVSGIDLYYEMQGQHTQGSGTKVLFISGTGGDLRTRPNVFDGPLPQSHQVLSYDQRGLGQSSKP
jgi:3-oxoadipate enol-lactonase